MAVPLGKDATINRNTGSFGSPTYNPIDNVRNVSYDATRVVVDTTTRASDVKTSKTSMKVLKVMCELLYDTGDADYTAIRDAFNNNTVLELCILDGGQTTAGSQGWHGDFYVTKFSRKEDLEGAILFDVEFEPAKTSNVLTWVTIS